MHPSFHTMKTLRSIIASTAIASLCIGVIPTASAKIIENSSPRGFKRNITRAREQLKKECQHFEDKNEKRACIKKYRSSIRKNATPITEDHINYNKEIRENACAQLGSTAARRSCSRSPRGNVQRTRTRVMKQEREKCRESATADEKLKCLRGQGRVRQSKVGKRMPRNIRQDKAPIKFIAPQGLRRNLSRSRDLKKDECGEIRNGNSKRLCYKRIESLYEGY